MKSTSGIAAPDALVGAVALEYVLLKFKSVLNEDPDFGGAFHVLSGFSAEQLVGFIEAKNAAGVRASRLELQIPEFGVRGYQVDTSCLTHDSALNVRNRERNGSVVVTAELEEDEGASIADSDRTDAADLKDKALASLWVEFVARELGLTLLPEELRRVEAMLRGLFQTGRCPTTKAGEFLQQTLANHKDLPLGRAAGKALPILGLPLFEECFGSLNDAKMGQASQWAAKLSGHYGVECYLDKRGVSSEPLDEDRLRETLSRLSGEEQQPPIPVDILHAFRRYIEANDSRDAAEDLLLKFDWSVTRFCFDKTRKTTSKTFSDRTRAALTAEGIATTQDDELVIQSLGKMGRKPGKAPDEFREFFERRADALEKDAALYLDWEDFVHGKKIECTDLLQGLFESVQRGVRVLAADDDAYMVIEGRDQKKPNSFLEMNQRACEFFERNYGSIEARTHKKIQFRDTLVVRYSKDVLPIIRDKPKFNGSKKSGKATSLSFLVSVFQKRPGKTNDRKVSTWTLTWKFATDSVLAQETADFDALCRYQAKRHTALVGCVAAYEVVGRKGVPLSLSLESVDGFADAARSGGRGAFIPSQDQIKSLAAEWKQTLARAGEQRWILPTVAATLDAHFKHFDAEYTQSILELRKDAFAGERSTSTADAYRRLILAVNALSNDDARRQLVRLVHRVGMAQVERAGRRPPMAVVCPWHPLRMEATAARQLQALGLIAKLLGKERPPFSDGLSGTLFFREVEQLLDHPLYPEIALVWEGTQAFPRVVNQAFGAYTLHQPAEPADESSMPGVDDGSSAAAAAIERAIEEYLRLQPHERDNLSVLLYNCDSPDLPMAVVKSINRFNARREDERITCQILLMHRDEDHLRQIYRDLVARGIDAESDPTEASGDFLAKVRVNISAANRLRRPTGRTQPVDIAYCRDLISRQARPEWIWVKRETLTPAELKPHEWGRRLPVTEGDRKVKLQLACPAQTETGWAYLHSIAVLCANGADEAWAAGKCPVLMRCLDFNDQNVDRIFKETHDLAVWVINQDELLDRRLLEARNVKVIRYVQSATHGRNLIISSDARETLLINTLKEKLRALLPSETSDQVIAALCKQFIGDANKISGGLVLKAARRANNTNELLGMVLSRYLVQSELGPNRPIAWCFLDDYSEWLGKKEGANIADLLVLAPALDADGGLHLDVIVTEAKFITNDTLANAAGTSAKQLVDTLSQLTEALDGDTRTIDQDIWLARLSALLVSETVAAPGCPPLDTAAWRYALRTRQCSVSIWGYSHVFIHEPLDLTAQISSVKGIVERKGRTTLDALQEVFGPGHVRELVLHFHREDHKETKQLRVRNGNDRFGKAKIYHLAGRGGRTLQGTASGGGSEVSRPPDDDGAVPGNPFSPVALVQRSASPNVPTTATNQLIQLSASSSLASTATGQSKQPSAIPNVTAAATGGGPSSTLEPASSLIAFLESRAALFSTSEVEGRAWLETTTAQLRKALVSRGLPAKLAEGVVPILTPNAGIIKLQGAKELTVQAVESRADEIFTSDGLKIINTSPESGRVSVAVARPNRQVLHTEVVLLDYLRTYNQAAHGERLCVGVREEDGQPMLLDPFNQPHTLIAGITGSGKSVLMQNLILSIAATRSPEEAHIYLIDPKFGVDYRPLDELPHVLLGSERIVDDSNDAIEILSGLVDEMNRRYELFKRAKVPNVLAYRRITGNALPTLWIIHDEFADWMQTDEYKETVPDVVGRLSVKARAAGIFLIFAAQRPSADVMPMQLRSQLGNRLILKVDNAGTAEIATGIKNSRAERLLGRGHMLASTGDTPDPVFVQVPFIDMEHTIPEIVRLIRLQYGSPSNQAGS